MGRTIAWVLSIGLLIITGAAGVREGLTEWHEGRTALQHSVTAAVLLYGILGFSAAYGLFRHRRWSVATAIAWGLAVTYAAGVAVISDGDADASIGSALAASASCAVIALGVIWTARVTTRNESRAADA